MSLTIGNNVTGITFNGNPVTSLVYNGVTVWTSGGGGGDEPIDYSTIPMTIKMLEAGTLGFSRNSAVSGAPTHTIKYKVNNGSESTFTLDHNGNAFQYPSDLSNLQAGDTITFIELPSLTYITNYWFSIDTGGKLFEVYGNAALSTPTMATALYRRLFAQSACKSIKNLILHDTVAENCYYQMFISSNLEEVNENLLPATTLARGCYNAMFSETRITSAPILPALTLANTCYMNMFNSCSSLSYIKMLATNISASSCLRNWVTGVASSGTFVKNSSATWTTTGTAGVPSGWTVTYASS